MVPATTVFRRAAPTILSGEFDGRRCCPRPVGGCHGRHSPGRFTREAFIVASRPRRGRRWSQWSSSSTPAAAACRCADRHHYRAATGQAPRRLPRRLQFRPIDLFFANAGVSVGTDLSTSEEDWELSFNVNVHAYRWAAKYLLPGWLARGEGYFCSTASAAGLLSQIGSAPYSLTKHAAVAFAEWMSITYGDRGVRVSCLCPQGVNTNMLNGGPITGSGAGDVVRASGMVLEPDDVAQVAAGIIRSETFLILPHPEVLTYLQRKTGDYDRWLAGMRKLQARIMGG